ncbi:hypothetical protein [Kribbella sindirgiensis]|uniref:GNAT family N-acetyltransferase n=1 Tax=Kribbella sindirgiensis TaxID=1124744 RepID=A0A4R0IPN0_9ACTN|nr:hypothetical protein [Kribbella sindirgiensis]TCC34917.1 hypothetical protein E0H50_13580 [Kribbella sindirgiensis]
MYNTLVVRLAETDRDLCRVQELRRTECDAQSWFHPDQDDARDQAGFVWMAEADNMLLATIRAVPYSSGIGELSGVDLPFALPPLDDRCLEVGRFVAHPAAGVGTACLLLYRAASWLIANSAYTQAYGMCAGPMVPYYRRIGMAVSREGHPIPHFGPQLSYLIHGDLPCRN